MTIFSLGDYGTDTTAGTYYRDDYCPHCGRSCSCRSKTIYAVYSAWDVASDYKDEEILHLAKEAIRFERAKLTRYGIEDCAKRHDSFCGNPSEHHILRWQWRGARGFRFMQRKPKWGLGE